MRDRAWEGTHQVSQSVCGKHLPDVRKLGTGACDKRGYRALAHFLGHELLLLFPARLRVQVRVPQPQPACQGGVVSCCVDIMSMLCHVCTGS
jgi:hypothetical protein